MNAVVVSKRLAEGLVNYLAEQRESVRGARDAWRSAEGEASAARARAAAALDAAHAAQLNRDANEEELTVHATELQAVTGRANHLARRARAALADSVTDAEIAAANARTKTPRMAPEDAALVDCAVDETLEVARAARAEARLGRSPEDADRERRDAFARMVAAEESSTPGGSVSASTADAAPRKRRRRTKPDIRIIDGVEMVVGIDSMVLVLQAEHVGCRPQTLLNALNNKGEIEGAFVLEEGKNPPWAVPRRALVAWGVARSHVAP